MEDELRKKARMRKGENDIDDEDVYSHEARDMMVEDDEMSPEEEGFMDGYEGYKEEE